MITKNILKIKWFILILCNGLFGQTIGLQGQLSGWNSFSESTSGQSVLTSLGVRYIPSLSLFRSFSDTKALDLEVSGNLFSSFVMESFDFSDDKSEVKFHRLWLRYRFSTGEFRLGLQKINFGTALLFRSLMWFDRIDPRDPIGFTTGVYALRTRYFFPNNANIWLWGLYGNNKPKGLEFAFTRDKNAEFGGRFQFPFFSGEMAFSTHHRSVEGEIFKNISNLVKSSLPGSVPGPVPEHRYAIDGQLDLGIGIWFESVLIQYNNDLIEKKWQKFLTFGADYTFSFGHGLHVLYENFILTITKESLSFQDETLFSGLLISYPLNIIDMVNIISYYDWDNRTLYPYVNWQRIYDRISINLSVFKNPERMELNQQGNSARIFSGGNGIQFMLIYHH